MIRRQSVIIEGLTLANEVSSYGGGAVEDLRQKLEQVDGKLEATESYCYQMVEENVELWSCSNFNRKRDEERENNTITRAHFIGSTPLDQLTKTLHSLDCFTQICAIIRVYLMFEFISKYYTYIISKRISVYSAQ